MSQLEYEAAMKVPYQFTAPPPRWIGSFPDGDYTIGRGADPRSAAERAADPDGAIARRKRDAGEAKAKAKPARRRRAALSQGAE